MKHRSWEYLVLAGAAVSFVACKDTLTPLTISDAQLTSNVAASTGDAVANEVGYLTGNESFSGLPSSQPSFNLFGSAQDSEAVSISRTRTCFDSLGAVIATCTPVSSVRKIVTHLSVNGSRVGAFFSGFVHRVADDTLTRVPNGARTADSLRIHSGVASAHDTTTFNDTTVSALHVENATDSINAVTFRIPRTTYPYPISGSIVRNVAIHAEYTKGGATVTRDVTKRVEVDFNGTSTATLKIDGKTCDLSISPLQHSVTNCH